MLWQSRSLILTPDVMMPNEEFRFDSDVGKSIDRFNGSGFIISRVVQLFDKLLSAVFI
jgi:hypothetical protein